MARSFFAGTFVTLNLIQHPEKGRITFLWIVDQVRNDMTAFFDVLQVNIYSELTLG